MNNKDKSLEKLNEIIFSAPKKYQKNFYLLRALVYEQNGEKEKSQKDM